MARGSKEDIQDQALQRMDKLNRHNKTVEVKNLSLAEQLQELKRHTELSESEKLKELSYPDWKRKVLVDSGNSKHYNFPSRFFIWVYAKHNPQMETFHRNGTPLNEVFKWLMETSHDFINY